MHAQLVARDLTYSHGPNLVLDGVSLTIAPGMRIGIVGSNGVGKTTLLRLLAGELAPERGSVERIPGDATVGLLSQELEVVGGETAGQLVARRTGIAAATAALDAATADVAAGTPGSGDRYSSALDRWLRLGGADLDHRLGAALDDVGLGADRVDQPAGQLSGGERARLNLASVLLAGFDVLELDEPTNDLDLAGLALLEDFLTSTSTGIVLVSHDRTFLERVVTAVVELDEHARSGTRYEGGWQAYLDTRTAARRHAEEAYATFAGKRDALRSRAQQQREWASQGQAKVRRSDESDKYIRHFRMDQTEKLAGKAKATERALERLDVVDKPWEGWQLRLDFAAADRAGREVLRLRGVEAAYEGFHLGPIDLDVTHGERVAIIGPNGSGKTTLLRLALGEREPTAGEARLGPSVVPGTLDQARRRFADAPCLLDAFVSETGITATEARAQLAKLGLGAEHIQRSTEALSPGERTRAVLAAFAAVGVNLLVLDEPTNHLDLPAIEQLEAALDQFPGTVLLVTHDRSLLATVSLTRTIELRGGQLVRDEST